MAVVLYFETKKQNLKDYPSNKKYVCIAEPIRPTPENGKKRLSAEQKKKYEADMEQYKECIKLLESGHVNIYNNSIEPEDSENFATKMLYDGIPERYRLFRINPIQSRKIYERYSQDRIVLSEFEIEKEIKTADELLDILVDNYDYFSIENQIFKEGTYANHRERAFKVFKNLCDKTKDKYLEDLIHEYCPYFGGEVSVHSYYDNQDAHDFAKQLMDLGYVNLYYEKSTHIWLYIVRLLKLKWTDFALEVIKAFENNQEQIKEIRENKQVQDLLSYMTDDSNVKEIIKLLNINTNKLILVVKEDIDDGYDEREVEIKEFNDMGELRSYLITEYKMPFDIASKDIDDTYWNYMTFNVEQRS